jgi:hypothetical protein
MYNDPSNEDSVTTIAHYVADQVPDGELAIGLWDDSFLTLGGRLGAIYGNSISRLPSAAYYVVAAGAVDVWVSTSGIDDDRRVCALARLEGMPPSREGMRTMALELEGSRTIDVVVRGDELWAKCTIPFSRAIGPNLEGAIHAVSGLVRKLNAGQAHAGAPRKTARSIWN